VTEEVKFKLFLQGSDGKNYLSDLSDPKHINWLHQKFGISPLKAKLGELERRVEELEKPARQQKIVQLLKGELSGRTERWIKRRIPDFQYSDLSDLRASNLVQSFRIGNYWKYRLKEA